MKKANKCESLSDRIKDYESVSDIVLMRRTPVMIRLDGRAFSKFTKGLNKPFDENFSYCMEQTLKYLCENVFNCVFGYSQSDEITLVLVDDKQLNTQTMFGNRVQKLVSVIASMATSKFTSCMFLLAEGGEYPDHTTSEAEKLLWKQKIKEAPVFDARAFNIPKEDVCNALIWRQQDATRNSIFALARSQFSHKKVQSKNTSTLQDMLMCEKGINWNDLPTKFKRGFACYKKLEMCPVQHIKYDKEDDLQVILRNKWQLDLEMPILTQARNYVEEHLWN